MNTRMFYFKYIKKLPSTTNFRHRTNKIKSTEKPVYSTLCLFTLPSSRNISINNVCSQTACLHSEKCPLGPILVWVRSVCTKENASFFFASTTSSSLFSLFLWSISELKDWEKVTLREITEVIMPDVEISFFCHFHLLTHSSNWLTAYCILSAIA